MNMLPANPLILVIDDEPDWQKTIRELLQQLSSNIEVVGSAEAAMRFMKTHGPGDLEPIRLIVFDVIMPWQDGQHAEPIGGINLLPALLLKYNFVQPRIPVVVFTAFPSYEDCIECVKAGAYYYLPKTEPGKNRPEDLVRVCRQALSGDNSTVGLPPQSWAEAHWPELERSFAGKYIAVLSDEVSLRLPARARFARVGGWLVIAGDSFEEVRSIITEDETLRRRRPMIFAVGSKPS